MEGSPEFQGTKKRLMQLVNDEFKRNRLELSQLMALLFILGQARDEEELMIQTEVFAAHFPALGDFLSEKKGKIQSGLEKELQEILNLMVADSPVQAAEIAQVAMKEHLNMQTLVARFPELQKYKK